MQKLVAVCLGAVVLAVVPLRSGAAEGASPTSAKRLRSLADPTPADLADLTDLAELAARVDAAAEALERAREAARDELAALRAERAELERQVRAERLRRQTLLALRAEGARRHEARDAETRRWQAPLLAAIDAARAHVDAGLPFAQPERRAELDRIARDLSAGFPDQAHALERLLRFLEEEEAMGREVSLSQQRIELDGAPVLAEVLRFAMALSYFRLPDGRVGWIHPRGAQWRVETIGDPELARIVEARFEAHRRGHGLGVAELVLPADPSPRKDAAR